MFTYPIGSTVWAPAVVALLKDAVTVQEIFQYPLAQTDLHLEEFQASLTQTPAENRGSIILIQISVDMIGLFLTASTGERQTFRRHETIIRRFPLSAFCFAKEDLHTIRPERWEASIRHFTYQPDFSQERLTVQLSFSLHLCGVQNRIVSLSEVLPSQVSPSERATVSADFEQIQRMQQEIARCQEEISTLKNYIQQLKKTSDKAFSGSAPTQKATIGKKTAQYRHMRSFSAE